MPVYLRESIKRKQLLSISVASAVIISLIFLLVLNIHKACSDGSTVTISDSGGSRNWDDPLSWVGGTVPTSADDVVATATSGPLTINTAAAVRSIDLTNYTSTLTHNASTTLSVGDSSGGVLNFTGAWTYTKGDANTSAISFVSTSDNSDNGWPITWGGKTPGNLSFNGVYGKWKLQDGYTNTTANLTLSAGELDINGQTVGISRFAPQNVDYATLTLTGNSNLTVNSASGWSSDNFYKWKLNSGTSTITFTGAAVNFYGGDHVYYNVVFTGSGIPTIYDTNTFNDLTRTGTAAKTDGIAFAYNQTINGTLTLDGNSTINRLLVKSITPGAQRTLTAASNSISNADFQDIKFAGTQSKDLRAIAGLSGDCGGNDTAGGMQFTDAVTQTWTHGAAASYNWSDATQWTSRVPLPQDDVNFGATSFGAAGKTVVADMPRLGKNISWTDATNSPTWTLSTTTNTIYGSLTLISAMTKAAGNQQLWFSGRSADLTITSAGKQFYQLYISAPSGTYTLTDALVAGYKIQVDTGGFVSAGKSITYTYGFISSGSLTRTVDLTGSTVTQTNANLGIFWNFENTSNLTFSAPDNIFISYGAAASIFKGGGLTYKNISVAPGAGVTTFANNFTFANLTMSSAGTKTIKFTKNTTYTMTGTNFLSGTAGNIVTVSSDTPGSTFTLNKTGGSAINSDYLSIQDSIATPSESWFAGTHSTNISGNSGWIFSSPIIISSIGGNWSDPATWAGGVVPTSADSVFASATSGNITIDSDAAARNIDLTNYTGTLIQNADTTLSVGDNSGGSLTFSSGMTYSPQNNSTSLIRFVSTTTGNKLTWAGKSIGSTVFDGAGGNWIFQDTATINGNLSVVNSDTSGAGVDFNNQPVNVMGNFQMQSGKLTVGPSAFNISGTRTINAGTIVDNTSTSYGYFKLSIDSTTHNDYGASYPITYQFAIPSGSANLKVYKKYNISSSWTQITEKTSSDFYNAIEAARFDYTNNVAYVSVAFNANSDNIYLKITDNSGNIIASNYQGIPQYYDNRQAAVTVTGDGAGDKTNVDAAFKAAADALSSREIWSSLGIVTQGTRQNNGSPVVDWSEVQSIIDNGYVELVSHSREHLGNGSGFSVFNHKYTGTYTGADDEHNIMTDAAATFPIDHPPYSDNFIGWTIDNTTDGSSCAITASSATTVTCAGGLSGGIENDWDAGDTYTIDRYDEEIGGSKDDITANLSLNSLNKKGSSQYVYAYLEPFGNFNDPQIHTKVGEYKYLIARSTTGVSDMFSIWDTAAGTYNRISSSYLYSDSNMIDVPNKKFNTVIDAGGIYHFWMHPHSISWSPGSRILDHLDYIKERTNIWYVGFGHLYLYHYIADQDKVEVAKASVPTVTTQAASTITSSSATLNGNITTNGNENATTRGFKYYKSANCTGIESTKSESGSFGTGTYSLALTDLVSNTTYSYKSFADNPAGTGMGSCQSFTTASSSSSDSGSDSDSDSDSGGTPGTAEQIIQTIRDYASSMPWSSFRVNGETITNSEVCFDATGYLKDKNIIKYQWDFGDGAHSFGIRVCHNYNAPGRYIIELTATDSTGFKYKTNQSVDVLPTAPTIENIKSKESAIFIEGHSDPNTIVYFTIHSEPFEGKGLADKEGYWTYYLDNADKTIGEGDHTISATAAVKLADNSEIRGKTSKDYTFKLTVDDGKLKIETKKIRIWQYVSLGLGLLLLTVFIRTRARKTRMDR